MTSPSTTPPPPDTDRAQRPVESDLSLGVVDRNASVSTETLQVLEESLALSKTTVVTGTVRVSTRTDVVDEVAEIALRHEVVDVSRVPIGRMVEEAPSVRTEGDTTIVPVLEERYEIVKRLYLKEELRIRRRAETEMSYTPVVLRRQTAVVEHLDADGRIIPEAEASQT